MSHINKFVIGIAYNSLKDIGIIQTMKNMLTYII